LRQVAADLAGYAESAPSSIPPDAWRGPSADVANEQLIGIVGHLRRVSDSLTRGAGIFSQLATDLDAVETAAAEAARRTPPPLPMLDTAAVARLSPTDAIQFESRASSARDKAATSLRGLAAEVVLSAHIAYIPPEAQRLQQELAGMSAEEKAILVADIAGILDPTPISDSTATVLALNSGDVPGALLSLLGVLPYLGDVAKAAKYGSKLKYFDELGDAKRELNALETVVDLSKDTDAVESIARLPSRTISKSGYTFITDEFGRPYVASGYLRLDSAERSGLESVIGKLGSSGDHGGHLIAARFGGPSEVFNLVPQAQFINQSVYKTLENEWDTLLRQGRRVDVRITTSYDSIGSLRPDGFLVEYSVDGVERPAQYFLNEQW
jgi:hypothetical protein